MGRAGAPDIVPTRMCVRFWYRPSWSSVGTERESGSGPGKAARLLTVGDRDRESGDGWWELSITPDGTRFEFSCASGPRDVLTLQSDPVKFTAGRWSEIVFSTFDGRVQGFQDDRMFVWKSPARLPALPAAAVRRGLGLGGRVGEPTAAAGEMGKVEIFDAPLARVEVFKQSQVMGAVPSPDGRGLLVRWKIHPQTSFELERTEEGRTNWVVLDRGVERGEFLDTNLVRGQAYQYRVMTNRNLSFTPGILRAGWRMPALEQRGVVALLVDETLAGALASDLDRWERDLVADGWRTVRRTVPRHDDSDWSKNTNSIARVRQVVQTEWQTHSNALRTVVLVGHVAIPYAGHWAEDSHTGAGDNHYGAWPHDLYYGDVDGIWSDKLDHLSHLARVKFPITDNRPGDGKFDSAWIAPNAAGQSRLELSVGRLDFSGLPALARGRNGELELLSHYLEKAHRYRMGELPAQRRAVAAGYLYSGADFGAFYNAYRTSSRLFGFEIDDLFEANMFELGAGQESLWGFLAGAGDVDRVLVGTPSLVTSSMLDEPRRQPRVVFAMLLGSWFGDWALGKNNLLRTLAASRNYCLATMWVRSTEWHFDPMAFGGTLGDGQLLTANECVAPDATSRGTTRTLSILGDPTLRLHPAAPPKSVRGVRSGDSVRLTWQSSRDAKDGYFVYRSLGGLQGPWERLPSPDPRERQYADDHSPAGALYQVRAVQTVATGSGSYTNLSLGVFWPESAAR